MVVLVVVAGLLEVLIEVFTGAAEVLGLVDSTEVLNGTLAVTVNIVEGLLVSLVDKLVNWVLGVADSVIGLVMTVDKLTEELDGLRDVAVNALDSVVIVLATVAGGCDDEGMVEVVIVMLVSVFDGFGGMPVVAMDDMVNGLVDMSGIAVKGLFVVSEKVVRGLNTVLEGVVDGPEVVPDKMVNGLVVVLERVDEKSVIVLVCAVDGLADALDIVVGRRVVLLDCVVDGPVEI